MIRFALYSLALAVVLIAAGWFAVNPGQVTIDWLGYRIEAPVGLLALGVALIAFLLTALLRFWDFLVTAPRRLRLWRDARRRRHGYRALSRGMVAVAAGDAAAARLSSRRAEALLAAGETPLPLLLAAQAAQLEGDEREAQRCFTLMLQRPETEFLGLRGLLSQSARAGDMPRALTLAKRAYELKPNTPWVLTALFDLLIRQGEWRAAEEIVERAEKRKVLAPARAKRDLAILAHAQSLQAERNNEGPAALRFARRAHRLAPDLAPLAVRLAALLVKDDHRREAVKIIEQSWPLAPQPELARLYLEARPESDPLKRVGTIERLAKLAPNHLETHLALARAAMSAELWGKARSELAAATGAGKPAGNPGTAGNNAALDPPARAFRMLAELEEAEHGDGAAARRALERAGFARPDEAWTCRECGARAIDWTPLCPGCQAFDTLEWASPRPIAILASDPGLHGKKAAVGPELAGPGLASPLPPAADKDRTPPPIITAAPNRSTS
jgi:HemY protein